MNKKLEKKIAKKLTLLDSIIEEIRSIDINPDDSQMWDPDYYYDLESSLETALALLQDKKHDREKNQYGNPIVLEPGILTLIDEYTSEEEENEEDE